MHKKGRVIAAFFVHEKCLELGLLVCCHRNSGIAGYRY